MNKVTLQGYLGKDFELSIFNGSNGNDSFKVTSDLAVSESKWNPKTSVYDETTTWYRIESGRSSIVKNAVFFRKGMLVQVVGDLTMMTYSKRDQVTNMSYDVLLPVVKVQEIVAVMVDPAMAYWFAVNYKRAFTQEARTQAVTMANNQGMAQRDFRQGATSPQAQQTYVQNNMQQGYASPAPQGYTPPATGFAQPGYPASAPAPTANYGQAPTATTNYGQAPATTGGFGNPQFAPPNANRFKAPSAPAQAPTVATNQPPTNSFANAGYGRNTPPQAPANQVAPQQATPTFNSFAAPNNTATTANNVAPASSTVANK